MDHEYVDLEVAILLLKVYALCEEGHAIMDCLFVHFHIKTCITRLESQNVVGTLMNQSQEQELGIHVV
jgi:hypothetical protein